MPYIGNVKVRVEKSWPRSHLREYFVDEPLSDLTLTSNVGSDNLMSTMRKVYLWPADLEHYEHSLKTIGPVGTRLIDALNEIVGIDMIFLKKNSVSIVKKKDSAWRVLEPKILSALKIALEA